MRGFEVFYQKVCIRDGRCVRDVRKVLSDEIKDASNVLGGSVFRERSLVPVEVTKSGAVPFSLKYTP